MNPYIIKTMIVLLVGCSSMLSLASDSSSVVNIYSARKEALIRPLLERFRDKTGINYRLITGKSDDLLKRIEMEGKGTPADVLITVDAGRLQRAKAADIFQPIDSPILNKTIPVYLRDPDNYWFGLSRRARSILYAKDRVEPEELSTYESLSDKKWEKRLCLRSSNNIYNQSLVSAMLEHLGKESTEKWVKGLVRNFARPPGGGDTDQIYAVAAGQCDVTVVNTYYLMRLMNSDKERDRAIAKKIDIFWPNQQSQGVHMNVSGVGMTKYARHPHEAKKLLEFLMTPESQRWYAEINYEYPVVLEVPISDMLRSFGEFKSDTLNLTLLGTNNKEALKLMDRAGWR